MNRYRFLAWPAYLVAGMLIVIPFFDAAMSLWPWRPSAAQWRFGALGLTSNAFMIPAAGALIVLVTALQLGHWRTLRVLGVVSAIGAVVTGLSIGLFALDAMQTRVNVAETARLSFTVASLTAAAKLVLATLTLAGLAVAGLRTPRERRAAAAQTSSPLLSNVTR
jgi:hypothetical protein